MTNASEPTELAQRAIDGIVSPLIGVDQARVVRLWNTAAERLSGCPRERALGSPLSVLWPALDALPELARGLVTGQPIRLQEQPGLGGQDTRFWDLEVMPWSPDGAAGVLLRLDDATTRVAARRNEFLTKKMESLGILMRGLAQELSNPLAGMLQNVQVVRNRLREEPRANQQAAAASGLELKALRDYLQRRQIDTRLDAIMSSGSRAVDLIDTMLGFSHHHVAPPQKRDPQQLLDRAVDLAAALDRCQSQRRFMDIRIRREYAAELPWIDCYPGPLEQVLATLLLHIGQRLQYPGDASADPYIILRLQAGDDRLWIEIEDNGPLLAPAEQESFFDPFVRQMDLGYGRTGLGLSLCYYTIVEHHQGRIDIASGVEGGSVCRIELPVDGQGAAPLPG